MIRYSVLIPLRNAGNELARQIPELRRVLDMLSLPYEVICIDQASDAPTRAVLGQLLKQHTFLRVLAMDRSVGLEAALAAGVAAARGALVVAIGPGKEYPVQQIPHLIAELAHADIVFGRQKPVGWAHARQQLFAWPQRWLFGGQTKNADGLFWAARREAVSGLESARGTSRFLPWLVALRGFRVGETAVRFQPPRRSVHDAWFHPADLLAVWWLRRRYRPAKVEELRVDPAEVAVPAMAASVAAPIPVTPAVATANRWIDAAQGLARRDIDARQRDSA